jgi:phosphoribosylamine-glycine ligase
VRRLGSGFANLLQAASIGATLPEPEVLPNAVASVVLASGGYPGTYGKGMPIEIPAFDPSIVVFHAGTAMQAGRLVTSGGRVLAVSATGTSIEGARTAAYQAASQIHFEGKFYRTDVAA